jgi:probable rRNA maturation factor
MPVSVFDNLPEPVEVQAAAVPAPPAAIVIEWARAALGNDQRSICIRIVDERESKSLNTQFRDRASPTNVLSFPAQMSGLLGDIAICAPIVKREARSGNKSFDAHFAHMVVHGILHLKGLDHMDDAQARNMEAREIQILDSLGFANPYLRCDGTTSRVRR